MRISHVYTCAVEVFRKINYSSTTANFMKNLQVIKKNFNR